MEGDRPSNVRKSGVRGPGVLRWPILGVTRKVAIAPEAVPGNNLVDRDLEVLHETGGSSRNATAAHRVGARKGQELPFSEDEIQALKRETTEVMEQWEIKISRTSEDRTDIPIENRHLDAMLRSAGDPEVSLGSFAIGVRLDPGIRMPRLPALYVKKRRWRLPDQADPVAWQEERTAAQGVWRRNYSTMAEWSEECVKIMNDQAEWGQVLRLSEEEARRRFPCLTVASLGAQKKKKPGGEVTARILFDGTHGIDVNTRTRIRDQERAPIAADVKRVLREKAKQGEPTFALTADISEAHRQVPIDARDWHYMGCQVTSGSEVYVHTVGTFGIASASYHWSRVSSAVGRLSQHLVGRQANAWHLLVADDYHLDAGGKAYRAAIMAFFMLCAVAGVPLSWRKTAGGDTVS